MTTLSFHFDTTDFPVPSSFAGFRAASADPLIALGDKHVDLTARVEAVAATGGDAEYFAACEALALTSAEIIRASATSMEGVAVKLRLARLFVENAIDAPDAVPALLAGAIRDIDCLTAKTRN